MNLCLFVFPPFFSSFCSEQRVCLCPNYPIATNTFTNKLSLCLWYLISLIWICVSACKSVCDYFYCSVSMVKISIWKAWPTRWEWLRWMLLNCCDPRSAKRLQTMIWPPRVKQVLLSFVLLYGMHSWQLKTNRAEKVDFPNQNFRGLGEKWTNHGWAHKSIRINTMGP